MGTLNALAEVAADIAATNAKLEKTRLAADFLASLPEEDLAPAALFLTGAVFPSAAGRTLGVGYAQVRAAALAITGAAELDFDRTMLQWSDLGDTLRALWPGDRPGGVLSLHELHRRFEHLAALPAGATTAQAFLALLEELNADEAWIVAKIIAAELRIGLREGLVEDAVAKAFGVKPAEVRRAHQLTGDLGRVAVGVKNGTLAGLAVELFSPVKPMLASAETTAEALLARMAREDQDLWIEDKLDGIRAQAHCSPERVALFSRDLKDISGQFPEVLQALRLLPGELILDGELMAHRGGVALPFVDLQKRLGRKVLTPAVLAKAPVALFAFDLLFQDGEPLIDHPLSERRVRLESLPKPEGLYVVPVHRCPPTQLEAQFAASKARANEGLMLKQPDSAYTPGRRGLSWLKYKKALEPLDVVVTGVEYGHGRRREVLSDYTFAVRDEEKGTLVNIGKAYSGLTDAEILELTEYFKRNFVASYGRFHAVKPELVIEVAFEAIQESSRHKSGFALRFPRIVRVRTDRSIADINSLEDVRRQFREYRSTYDRDGALSE
jgi:DNA ligase-1